ncbi:MAG: 2,4-dichlorophenol 6-monooxygenase, partial [Hyphomicrobiaceae bacterium]
MTNVRTIEIPVLIAGGGPVGMSAALVLAYHGIESLVIERRDGPHRAPQAHVVNSRTLEIFRELGLDIEELNALATAQADGSVVRWCTRLFEEELAATPYERQGESCLPFTPTPLLNLSQHLLEPVLQRYVEALPTSRLAYGQQWETAQMDEDGVSSQVRNLADDSVYNVRSRYLIAADGAGSRVRKSRKITLNGPDELQSFV